MRNPSDAAAGRNTAGITKSLIRELAIVGFIFASALRPSNPAPSPISAKGVASCARLCNVLLAITGSFMRATEIISPKNIPRIMGFVAIPFRDFLKCSLSSPPPCGAVNDNIITAATLYSGTVASIINGAIALVP